MAEEARSDALQSLVGQTIDGRYRITELLGTGGVGAVYEAEHLGLGRKVAIKLLDREHARIEAIAGRFTREARAASSIESAHIVSVFDAGTCEGRPYLVMELLRGEDLGRRLRRCGKLSVVETLHIVAQTLHGLADAHEARIVHRDLKPDNLFLVSRKSDHNFVKIVDFGVSKMDRREGTESFITRAGTVLGTPLYMSPEQAQAAPDLDGQTDLYSLGAIMFECLTGRPPHVGESYEQIISSICMNDAPDVRTIDPSLSGEIATVLRRALHRERPRRYASARQMLVAVTTIPGYTPSPRDGSDPGIGVEMAAAAAVPIPKMEEPLAAKTLLAGGAAEPVRVSPVADLSRTVPMVAAPLDPPEPKTAESSPEVPPLQRRVRTATVVTTALVATAVGAAITMWALTR